MSAAIIPLTLTEFQARYGNSERHEFWNGEVVEKSMPTWLHFVVQGILIRLLVDAGFIAGPELRLRIGAEFEPLPDVAAGRKWISDPYPTQPDQIEVVVEILSPSDPFSKVEEKCAYYAGLGIAQAYVVNPVSLASYQWYAERRRLHDVDEWLLPNGAILSMAAVGHELEMLIRRSGENQDQR